MLKNAVSRLRERARGRDEYEKQSSIVSIHWWAITTVRQQIYATLALTLTLPFHKDRSSGLLGNLMTTVEPAPF